MKKGFILFKLFLLVLIFFLILKNVNIYDTVRLLEKTNPAFFLFAFLLSNTSSIFLTIKWFRLAKPLKSNASFTDLLKLNYIATFYSMLVPGQASGEVIKGLKLTKKETSMQKIWIPIIIDKITNLLIVCFIGFIAILADDNFRQNKPLVFSVAILTIILVFLTIVLFSENTSNFVSSLVKKLLQLFNFIKKGIQSPLTSLLNYHTSYKEQKYLLIETLGWSLLVKLPHIITFYLLALSLGINLSIVQSAWLFSIVSIVTILPVSFSGLGIREGTVIVLLSKIGIESSSALSLSALIFILGLMTGLIGGILELASGFKSKK